MPLRPVRPAHTRQPDTIQPDRQTASPVHPIRPAPGRRSVIHPLRPVQATRPKPSKRVTSHTPDTPRSRVPHVKPAVDNPSSLTETTPAYPVDTAPVSSVNPAIRQASTVRQIPSSENRSAARAPMTSQPNQAPSEPLQTHPATHPADRDPLATYRARMQQRLTQQPPPRTPAQPDTPPPVPRIMPSHTAHNRPRFITPDTHPAESNPPQHPAYDAPNDPSVTRASDANTAHHRPDYHTAPHNRPHPVSQTNAQRQAVDAPRTRQTSHTHPPAVSQRGTSHRSTATAPLSMQNGRWPLLIAEDNSSVVHRIQGDDTASDDAHPYDIHPTHKRDTSWNV